jgi:hypothetical protein
VNTNYTLGLTDDQLTQLGTIITGKPHRATRREITNWLDDLIAREMAPKPTKLVHGICPKCRRPVAIAVPNHMNPLTKRRTFEH